jgi:hypothetical protein
MHGATLAFTTGGATDNRRRGSAEPTSESTCGRWLRADGANAFLLRDKALEDWLNPLVFAHVVDNEIVIELPVGPRPAQ